MINVFDSQLFEDLCEAYGRRDYAKAINYISFIDEKNLPESYRELFEKIKINVTERIKPNCADCYLCN